MANFDNIDETAEDRSLGDLLRTLKRVDAPTDFDFKLKARIAARDPKADSRQGWWPLPVYVYPLLVLVVVAATFVFFYRPAGEPLQVATQDHDLVPANGSAQAPEVVTQNGNVDPQVLAAASPERTRTDGPAPQGGSKDLPLTSHPGGSMDQGLRPPEQILPPGFNNNAKRQVSPNIGGNSVSISTLLGFLGLDTRFEGQALKVTAVHSGSLGEKTGLKAGDIIEAVDNTPINSATRLGNSLDVKSFTVRRGTEQLHLNIRTQ